MCVAVLVFGCGLCFAMLCSAEAILFETEGFEEKVIWSKKFQVIVTTSTCSTSASSKFIAVDLSLDV